MKSFLTGLVAILIVGLIAITIRNQNFIPTATDPSPSPTSAPSNWDMEPETSQDNLPTESTEPTGSTVPKTKGGLTLGAGTSLTASTVLTESTTVITILESSDCLLDANSYIRDLTSPLTVKYDLMDNYSAIVTIWKESGESVLSQTLISGQGVLTTIDSLDNLKFQINSQDCVETSHTWLSISATQ